MNKILIASKNKDKIFIIKNIINSISKEKFEIFSLRDITITTKNENENGSIFKRAKDKAEESLAGLKNNIFKYVIGIDDGIVIKNHLYENVKELIKPILCGEFLTEGEVVYIARAYHFISNDKKEFSILTKIPFEFHKLKQDINVESNSYPLSNVLCQLNTNVPVSNNSAEDNNNYYLLYSYVPLSEVFNDNNR